VFLSRRGRPDTFGVGPVRHQGCDGKFRPSGGRQADSSAPHIEGEVNNFPFFIISSVGYMVQTLDGLEICSRVRIAQISIFLKKIIPISIVLSFVQSAQTYLPDHFLRLLKFPHISVD